MHANREVTLNSKCGGHTKLHSLAGNGSFQTPRGHLRLSFCLTCFGSGTLQRGDLSSIHITLVDLQWAKQSFIPEVPPRQTVKKSGKNNFTIYCYFSIGIIDRRHLDFFQAIRENCRDHFTSYYRGKEKSKKKIIKT